MRLPDGMRTVMPTAFAVYCATGVKMQLSWCFMSDIREGSAVICGVDCSVIFAF
jgi:hypothetical protein